MTAASCGDYSLLTPPPSDGHRGRVHGPVTALLYDEYESMPVAMPLHHRGAYNLTWHQPSDLRQHHHQQQQQQMSSSYQFDGVIDRSQSSTFHDTRQLAGTSTAAAPGSTTTAAAAADQHPHAGHYDASQRCDPSPYRTAADGPYGYATPAVGRCAAGGAIGGGGGGVPARPMTVGADVQRLQPDVLSPAYSPYGGGGGRCLQTAAPASSRADMHAMRTLSGCCVTGYCSPTAGPCRCGGSDRLLYDHSGGGGGGGHGGDLVVAVNGTGHIAAEHLSCRLQHQQLQQQQQQQPHHSAGTYKWMTIKRGTPKTTSSGRCRRIL